MVKPGYMPLYKLKANEADVRRKSRRAIRSDRDATVFKLSERFGWVCWYCDWDLRLFTASIDHIVPRSAGGEDDISNFALCCRMCNRAKLDMSLADFRVWIGRMGTGPLWRDGHDLADSGLAKGSKFDADGLSAGGIPGTPILGQNPN